MSILDAIKTAKRANDDLDSIASLPQAFIMQMAQRGDIPKEQLPIIIGRKAEMLQQQANMEALRKQQEGGVPPTVMEQLMAYNAQQEAPREVTDVGIASNETRPMEFAGGGIVAFDRGGDVGAEFDDDDEDEEDDRITQYTQALYAMAPGDTSMGPGVRVGLGSIRQDRPSGSGIRADGKLSFADAIKQVESGGRRYDKEGKLLTSSKGAKGEMQVLDTTNLDPGFGVRPAKDDSPEERARVGMDYLNAMLGRYGDPKLAAIAYNWGPGNTDRWLKSGADMKKLPDETKQYIAKLNKMGVVSLARGGEVDDTAYDPMTGMPLYGFDTTSEGLTERKKPTNFFMDQPWQRRAAKEENKKPAAKQATKAAEGYTDADLQAFDQAQALFEAERANRQVPPGSGQRPPKPKSFEDEMREYFASRKQEIAEGKKEARNMALLQAGLGMLGGTSPYAFANIGQGALGGAKAYGEQRKQLADEERALLSGQLGMYRYSNLAKAADFARRQTAMTGRQTAIENAIKNEMANRKLDVSALQSLKLKKNKKPEDIAEIRRIEGELQDIRSQAEQRFPDVYGGETFEGFSLVGSR